MVSIVLALLSLLQTSALVEVHPAFKWAQSADDVHIFVKHAHKMDTPADNSVKLQTIDIQKGSVSLNSTNDKKSMFVKISLLKEIDVDESSYTAGTFGVTLRLRKRETQERWSRLLKSKKNKPRNMHRWWEMW